MFPNGPNPDTRPPGRMPNYEPDQQGIRINCTGIQDDVSRLTVTDAVWKIPRYTDPTAIHAVPRINKGEITFTHPSFTRRTGEGDATMRPATAALNGLFPQGNLSVEEALMAIDAQIRVMGLNVRPYLPDTGDKTGFTVEVSGAHPVVFNHKESVFNTGDYVYWSLPDPRIGAAEQSDGDPLNDGGRSVLLFMSHDQFLKTRVFKDFVRRSAVNFQAYRDNVQYSMFAALGHLSLVSAAFIDRVLQGLNAADGSIPASSGDVNFIARVFGATKDQVLTVPAIKYLKDTILKNDMGKDALGDMPVTLSRALLFALTAPGSFSTLFTPSEMRTILAAVPSASSTLVHESPAAALSNACVEMWRFEDRHILGRIMKGGGHRDGGTVLLRG